MSTVATTISTSNLRESLTGSSASPKGIDRFFGVGAPASRQAVDDPLLTLSTLFREAVWDWDLATGQVRYSDRWRDLIGTSQHGLGDRVEGWLTRVHPADRDQLAADLEGFRIGQIDRIHSEHRLRRAGDQYIDVEATAVLIRGLAGEPERVLGTVTDITRQHLAERGLLYHTYHDPLTGLANRTAFLARIEDALDRPLSKDSSIAVMVIDLDRFRLVNDGLGPAHGNKLLIAAAERLRGILRSEDMLARLNGDEFALLVDPAPCLDHAREMGARMIDRLSDVFELDGYPVFLSASVGVAFAPGITTTAERLLQEASAAANHAKVLGRSRCEVFQPGMIERRQDALRREAELRQAIARNEFVLRYQPIVEVSDGRLSGFEALVRWNHPTEGEIDPNQFIPLAEETGLIVPLGEWILETACSQTRAWQRKFPTLAPLTVSVNLSRRQLADPDLVSQIERIRHRSDLAYDALRLEITESLMMEDVASATAMFGRLRDLGVGIHVDDFGTGYSSLSNLPSFPLDTLKIDRSFVAGMLESPRTEQIVQTIIALAGTLGLEVTAEGVESPTQFVKLRAMGCTHAQGYLFSPPLDVAAAEAFLSKQPAVCR